MDSNICSIIMRLTSKYNDRYTCSHNYEMIPRSLRTCYLYHCVSNVLGHLGPICIFYSPSILSRYLAHIVSMSCNNT